MNPWKALPKELPIDGSTVYVRIEYYYGTPFKAIWTLSTKTFTSLDNSIDYPAYVVARWRDI
jgi:hypothetical protein